MVSVIINKIKDFKKKYLDTIKLKTKFSEFIWTAHVNKAIKIMTEYKSVCNWLKFVMSCYAYIDNWSFY